MSPPCESPLSKSTGAASLSAWSGIGCDANAPSSVSYLSLQGGRIAGTLSPALATLQSLGSIYILATSVRGDSLRPCLCSGLSFLLFACFTYGGWLSLLTACPGHLGERGSLMAAACRGPSLFLLPLSPTVLTAASRPSPTANAIPP